MSNEYYSKEWSCIICAAEVAKYPESAILEKNSYGCRVPLKCNRCGKYNAFLHYKIPDSLRYKISGYVREINNEETKVDDELINKINLIPDKTTEDKLFLLLNQLSFSSKDINIKNDPSIISLCYAKNEDEINALIEYSESQEYIKRPDNNSKSFRLTVKGKIYLDSIPRKESDLCFIAMSFDENMKRAYETAIKKSVLDTGYRCQRVDENPHNEGIMDKIVSLIKKSRFIIADLTHQKNGVYYEAGFAKGIGLDVIFTCEKEDFKNIHFDVSHINILKWGKDKLEEFRESLKYRIEASIGCWKNENF